MAVFNSRKVSRRIWNPPYGVKQLLLVGQKLRRRERSNPAHSACSTNDFSSMARARWMRVLTLDSLESVIFCNLADGIPLHAQNQCLAVNQRHFVQQGNSLVQLQICQATSSGSA